MTAFNNAGRNSGCPCKDCEKRTVTCHGICREYQNWKKAEAVKKEARDQAARNSNTMSDAKMKTIWRKMRYSRRGPRNNHKEG